MLEAFLILLGYFQKLRVLKITSLLLGDLKKPSVFKIAPGHGDTKGNVAL